MSWGQAVKTRKIASASQDEAISHSLNPAACRGLRTGQSSRCENGVNAEHWQLVRLLVRAGCSASLVYKAVGVITLDSLMSQHLSRAGPGLRA